MNQKWLGGLRDSPDHLILGQHAASRYWSAEYSHFIADGPDTVWGTAFHGPKGQSAVELSLSLLTGLGGRHRGGIRGGATVGGRRQTELNRGVVAGALVNDHRNCDQVYIWARPRTVHNKDVPSPSPQKTRHLISPLHTPKGTRLRHGQC